MEKTRDKYWNLSKDDKLQEIKQGKLPEQVALEKAAYLMDAAMLGAEVSRCCSVLTLGIEGEQSRRRKEIRLIAERLVCCVFNWVMAQGITSWNDVRPQLAEVSTRYAKSYYHRHVPRSLTVLFPLPFLSMSAAIL